MKPKDKVVVAIGGSVVAALAVVTGIYLFGGSSADQSNTSWPSAASDATASTSNSGTSSSASSEASSAASAATYKDGTYSATISYSVPHGTNSLVAKVTVANNKVTDLSVDNDYADNESGMYIDSFESAIKSAVVGQDIGTLSLSRIGGATLTTQAFDDALTTIRNDAKA